MPIYKFWDKQEVWKLAAPDFLEFCRSDCRKCIPNFQSKSQCERKTFSLKEIRLSVAIGLIAANPDKGQKGQKEVEEENFRRNHLFTEKII